MDLVENIIEPAQFYCRFCKGTSKTMLCTEARRTTTTTRRWRVVTTVEIVQDNIRCCSHCGKEIEIWPELHIEENWSRR